MPEVYLTARTNGNWLTAGGVTHLFELENAHFEPEGRVALAVARQGSHRSGRACINASGSSANSFAIQIGPRSYSIE